MIIFIGDPTNVTATFPFFALAIFICFYGPPVAKIAVIFIMYAMIMSFSAIVDTFISVDFDYVIKMVYWGIIMLIVRSYMQRGGYELSARLWRLLILLSVMPFATTMSSIILSKEWVPIWALGVLPFAAVSSLSLMAAIMILAKNQKLEKEHSLINMRNQYYQNLEESQFQVKRLRHDMANHLSVLKGLQGNEAEEYLDSLINSPAIRKGKRFCENEVINILLSIKVPQMEEQKIHANIKTSVPNQIKIEDIDICAVYANCLDNAIEACMKLDENKRKITMLSKVHNGLLMLKLINSTNEDIKTENGKIKTSKNDEENHGYGLASIREIIDRYDGVMEINHDNTEFTLLITIPL